MAGEVTWGGWQDVEATEVEKSLGIEVEARMGESFSEEEGRAVHFQRRGKRQFVFMLPADLYEDVR